MPAKLTIVALGIGAVSEYIPQQARRGLRTLRTTESREEKPYYALVRYYPFLLYPSVTSAKTRCFKSVQSDEAYGRRER